MIPQLSGRFKIPAAPPETADGRDGSNILSDPAALHVSPVP